MDSKTLSLHKALSWIPVSNGSAASVTTRDLDSIGGQQWSPSSTTAQHQLLATPHGGICDWCSTCRPLLSCKTEHGIAPVVVVEFKDWSGRESAFRSWRCREMAARAFERQVAVSVLFWQQLKRDCGIQLVVLGLLSCCRELRLAAPYVSRSCCCQICGAVVLQQDEARSRRSDPLCVQAPMGTYRWWHQGTEACIHDCVFYSLSPAKEEGRHIQL
jgi:hypothetical protein